MEQFKSILDLIKAFPNEKACFEHLEILRWNGNVVSPFDPESKVYKCKGNRYKCKNTGKYFNVKVGTIFEDTKIPLQKWFIALYLVSSHKKGISSHQLARDIDVTQKTAWFMLHRLRYAFEHETFNKPLEGEIEADETYIGGKDKNRHEYKKIKGNQGRSTKDKTPVVGLVQRKGNLIVKRVGDVKKKSLQDVINQFVKEGSVLSTDEWHGYKGLNDKYVHGIVKHALNEYVRGNYHTNTIEGFWSLFKRGIVGIYHSVSKEHLQNYLNEFSFRYNTRGAETSQRFNVILGNSEGRLKYKDLIAHAD